MNARLSWVCTLVLNIGGKKALDREMVTKLAFRRPCCSEYHKEYQKIRSLPMNDIRINQIVGPRPFDDPLCEGTQERVEG
jgi:hypothetical protein